MEPFPEAHTFDLQHVCGDICGACGVVIQAAAKLHDCPPAFLSYPHASEAEVHGQRAGREPGLVHTMPGAQEFPGGNRAWVHLTAAKDYIKSLEPKKPRKLDDHYTPM